MHFECAGGFQMGLAGAMVSRLIKWRMVSKHFSLMALALAPLSASLMVLTAGGVGKGVWLMHVLSIGLAGLLAMSFPWVRRLAKQPGVRVAIMVLTLLGLA